MLSMLYRCWWLFGSLFLMMTTATSDSSGETIQLTSQELYQKILQGQELDALVDVRRQDEWDQGHIEGAFLVESLASYNGGMSSMTTGQGGTPNDLNGCQWCTLALYCSSGNRAGQAIQVLRANGFQGTLYNGLGVTDWKRAGYNASSTAPSVVPPCTTNETVSDVCQERVMGDGNTSGGRPPFTTHATTAVLLTGLVSLQWLGA